VNIISISVIVVFSFLLVLATGMPVAFSLFSLAILFDLIFLGPKSLFLAFTALYGNMDNQLFIAVPLFVLMACLLEFSGIASDLYETMHKWMGSLRGGLAMGTTVICALIDAMSGMGATATITMGVLALPEMLKRKYDKSLAIGCIPCGGALGPLIPPSIIMIILGGLTGLSVGKLFIGGFIPGLLITFFFCIYISIRCLINQNLGPPLPLEERGTWLERIISLKGVILSILLVFLILGGIYSGAFTPTEAGGIGAMGTFLIVLLRGKLSWNTLTKALYSSMRINAMVIWLLVGGTAYAALLNSLGIASKLASFLIGLPFSNLGVVCIMMFITFLMGCFVDGASILMIATPVFFPVVNTLGIDPLWFGVIYTMAMVVGYVTPPFGMNLFYMKGLVPEGVTMKDIWSSVTPYMLLMLLGLLICTLFPILVTWLPSLMK